MNLAEGGGGCLFFKIMSQPYNFLPSILYGTWGTLMWHLGMWFGSGLGSAGLTARLSDLGVFHPK